ncbi:protein of unknown function [Moritella yayanosii]|uniref:Uncharacterized protein n=1 Tax=Moritella yayanosii TaxID=69539 RepID=A0A330LLK3_9GAMM|nr:protein of unknown function [Moritella yayanosii]
MLAHKPIRSRALLALTANPLRTTLVARFTTEHRIDGAATVVRKLITKLPFKLVMMLTKQVNEGAHAKLQSSVNLSVALSKYALICRITRE